MSELDDNPFPLIDDVYHEWLECGRRCTGTRTDGKPCRAICRKVAYEWFWPGTSDRCIHHADGLDCRSREIANIASKSEAATLEKYSPFHRARKLKEIRRAGQARTAAVRRSASSPVEPTSRRANGAMGQLTFAFAASPAAQQPPGFGTGPRSLAAQLEEPPQLEPGPKPTVSNAIEIKKGESN
jgi:hypothetical protein